MSDNDCTQAALKGAEYGGLSGAAVGGLVGGLVGTGSGVIASPPMIIGGGVIGGGVAYSYGKNPLMGVALGALGGGAISVAGGATTGAISGATVGGVKGALLGGAFGYGLCKLGIVDFGAGVPFAPEHTRLPLPNLPYAPAGVRQR